MRSMRRRTEIQNVRTSVALAIAAVGIAGLAGCATGSAQADQMPQRLVTPSPTQVDPQEQAVTDARSVLEGWLKVDWTTVDPAATLPILEQYLVGDYEKEMRAELTKQVNAGWTFSGSPKLVSIKQVGPIVVEGKDPKGGNWRGPRVTFEVCSDWSNLRLFKGAKELPNDWQAKPFVQFTYSVFGFGDIDAKRVWEVAEKSGPVWCGP